MHHRLNAPMRFLSSAGARHFALLLSVAAFLAAGAGSAQAYWSGSAVPLGAEAPAAVASVGQGTVPTASRTGTGAVVVAWGAGNLSNGLPAAGYLVKRYAEGSGAQATIGSGCSGVITATSCTEAAVPVGHWRYRVTPLYGANWQGAAGGLSGTVDTEGGTLTLSRSLFGGTVAPLPATVGGAISNFSPGEKITYTLDGKTPLSGSPAQVGPEGSATITSLVIPGGTADGAHTIVVAGPKSEAGIGIVVDTTAPSGGSVDAVGLVGPDGRTSGSPTIEVAFAGGGDAGTGLASSGATLLRASAPLSFQGSNPGICGSFGAYAQVGAEDPASPATDTVAPGQSCYRYRYVVADRVGNQAVYTSPSIKVQPPPSGGVPVISGESSTLTGSTGGWSGSGIDYAYQWRRCDSSGNACADIAGANSGLYTLAEADVGKTLRFVVTATNAAGSAQAISAATAPISGAKPVSTSPPAIPGTPRKGQELFVEAGTWTGAGNTYASQWRRCDSSGNACVDIAGANASLYTPVEADVGQTLRIVVTATNAAGSTQATSAATVPTAGAPVNATAPSIGGSASVGSQLTANPGTWNGSPPPTYAYRWRRCDAAGNACVSIAEGSSTYTPVEADAGQTLRVLVIATNASGSAQATSAATAPITEAPTNAAVPSISGSATVGSQLTANLGSWSGSPPPSFAYQWRRCDGSGNACVDIASAKASNYTLAETDLGKTLRVVVTATNSAGSAVATSAATAPIAGAKPVSTSPPAIVGTPRKGQELLVETGTWTGAGNTYASQWRRCDSSGNACVDIAGANASLYTPVEADVGQTLRVVVTATNSAGSAQATSAATAPTAGAPVNATAPSIGGSATVGSQLTAGAGSWNGSPPPSLTYRWGRCDSSGNACATISSAESVTYTPVEADVGKTLRVLVTATNSAGSAQAISAPTAVVAYAAPVNTSPPTIFGSPQKGQPLVAVTGTWSGGTLTYTYQWRSCNGSGAACTDIPSANANSYTPVEADVGKTLRLLVTATNSAGSAQATSAPTAPVANAAPVNTILPTIFGAPQTGQPLVAGTGVWSGAAITYTYQWRRCDSFGNACADISNANASNYTLVAADVGATLRVVVTATNDGGSTKAASAATAKVGG